jgi:hypothetical protein
MLLKLTPKEENRKNSKTASSGLYGSPQFRRINVVIRRFKLKQRVQ